MLLDLVALVLLSPPATAQDFVPAISDNAFFQASTEKISIKCKKATELPSGLGGSLVELELNNRTGFAVEPYIFTVKARGKDAQEAQVTRLTPPHWGRLGRFVPADGKQIYHLHVPLDAKQAKKANYTVAASSFIQDEALLTWIKDREKLDEASLSIGKLKHTEGVYSGNGRKLDHTQVPIENKIDRPIEIILLAEYRAPHKTDALIHIMLEPMERREVLIDRMGTEDRYIRGAEIRKLEVVDWSLQIDNEDPGPSSLGSTLANWWRIPETQFPISIQFHYAIDAEIPIITPIEPGKVVRYEKPKTENIKEDANGTLRFSDAGEPRIETEDKLSPSAEHELNQLIEQLNWAIQPPDLSEFEQSKVELMVPGDFACLKITNAPDILQHDYVQIENGAITGSRKKVFGETRSSWSTETYQSAWYLSRRQDDTYFASHLPMLPESTLELDWKASSKGLELKGLEREWDDHLLGNKGTSSLTLRNWQLNAASSADEVASAPLPTGELADRLRQVWDGFYRLHSEENYEDPDLRVKFTGRITARNSGNDGVWKSYREISSTFRWLGLGVDGTWEVQNYELDKTVADGDRDSLTGILQDRVVMWSGRDPARLPSFAEQFRGARLTEGKRGWIEIESDELIALKRVRLVDGLLAAIQFRSGQTREYKWSQVGRHLVATQIRNGIEIQNYEYEVTTGGWLIPTHVEFLDVFSRDNYKWGPESLTFEAVQVEEL